MANIKIFGNILACTQPSASSDLATKGYVDSLVGSSKKTMTTLSGSSIAPTQSGQVFFKNISATTVLTFNAAGVQASTSELYEFYLILDSNSKTVGFPSGWTWINGSAPTTSVGGVFVIRVFTPDGAATWYADLIGTYSTLVNQILFTVRTTSANQLISLQSDSTYCPSPVSVNWGDGTTTTENFANAEIAHTYATPGTRQIKMSSADGRIPFCWFMSLEDTLLSVDSADVEWVTDNVDVNGKISVEFMFDSCSALTSIPGSLFAKNTNINNMGWCFHDCSSLSSLPSGLLSTGSNVVVVQSCFEGCSSIETIPSGFFDACTLVEHFKDCFKGCSDLTAIPSGLFDEHTAVTDFSGCFYGCSDLQAIPSGLFNENVLAADFSQCFAGCSSLTSVPFGLFNNAAANNSFYSCFSGCTSLTTVPTDLFDSITGADFRSVFGHCSSLVPSASSPYIPQVWEKDTAEFHLTETGSYYLASAAAKAYAPTTWGGTLEVYDPYYTYSSGDWCWYTVNGIPKVYTYINETSSSNHAPPDSNYWVYGYDLPSIATSVITFKKQKAGIGLSYYDLNYENGTYTITNDTPPISWTPGSFNSQTLSGTKSSGSANALMMSSWSLSGGVLRITLGAMASQMGLSSGSVLTFGGFVESEDSEWYYATSSTFS